MNDREKIVKIIEENGVYNGKSLSFDYYVVQPDDLADALIEAGIRDINQKGLVAVNGEVSIVTKNIIADAKDTLDGNLAEWKRRAEVAERIAREACKIVFSQEIDEEDWENVIYLYKEKHEKYRDEFGITEDMLYDCLKEQADKELAEEGER